MYLHDKVNLLEDINVSNNLYFCKKCGRIIWTLYFNGDLCDCCQSLLYEVPNEYIENFRWRDGDGEKALIEELVKTSPEFDQYLFDHRDEILAKQSAEFNAKLERGKAILERRDKGNKFGVECPYCHATNVKRITTTSKAVHTAIFGIFSMGRNAKNYHCNHCNSDF